MHTIQRKGLGMKFYGSLLTNFRFIELVDGKDVLACLKNGNDVVVSLPPITNSDITKVN